MHGFEIGPNSARRQPLSTANPQKNTAANTRRVANTGSSTGADFDDLLIDQPVVRGGSSGGVNRAAAPATRTGRQSGANVGRPPAGRQAAQDDGDLDSILTGLNDTNQTIQPARGGPQKVQEVLPKGKTQFYFITHLLLLLLHLFRLLRLRSFSPFF